MQRQTRAGEVSVLAGGTSSKRQRYNDCEIFRMHDGRLLRLYRHVRHGAPVIVVSGLPRSGTSMMMQMLAAGGVPLWTDGVRAADDSNPRGYYELEKVKELDKSGGASWIGEARGKAVKIVSALLTHLPDTCNYRVVFMQRDLREIVASQNQMLDERRESRGALSDEALIKAYETHLWQVRRLLQRRACFEVLDVGYSDVLKDAPTEATRVQSFLRIGLDVSQMPRVVEEALYRNRRP